MRIQRLVAAAATSVLLLGSLAGCFLLPAPQATSTPTGESVDGQIAPYYGQELVWESCGDGMQCTTAIAPMDWDDPGAHEDIELALVRQVAQGERQGSLFVNPGGPGSSGWNLIHDSIDYAVDEEIQSAYDVIGWDPRGVGRSSAVECYGDADLDEFLFGLPDGEPGTPEYIEEVTAAGTAFAEACAANTGELLGFIDTDSTVRDLDMLRAAVGDDSLNYLGYSYGSDIGAKYIDAFADRVGRVVLDGATDPTVSIFDVQMAQTTAFADALRAYLADCLQGRDCPFTGSVDDAIAQINDTLDRLDDAPLRGEDGRLLTSAYVSTAITAALYDEQTWPYLSQAFDEIARGSSTTAFLLADSYVDRDSDGTYRSNFFEAFFAINCIDYPVERDPAVLQQQAEAVAAADPLVDDDEVDALGDVVCANWPYQFDGEIGAVSGAGAAPVLVVGTTGDPATPYQWAVALSGQLESGVLVTYEGEGHIAYDSGDPCVTAAVDSYFVDGVVPTDGVTCGR
ncbi:alpha/beta hydrolase [Herbiconiux sp. L3-i23]|uniref:alpha/beta hydrolase n=1 Tax=Herbiconiux sp. L3-i23 TaxID=2905871 RepID=UPI00204FECAF|nr:alpha/beta hydrolase [Herbiconiux sp. L3-i23]BDI21534.1 alpha/beta hydrolase [Herbiconiux sp. L3-i23]